VQQQQHTRHKRISSAKRRRRNSSNKKEMPRRKKTAAEAVLCGGLAGCASKTAMAPLERARILLQVGKDTSFVEALRRVWRTEGFQGLWAGNGASILRVFPARGIAFAVNERLRPYVKRHAAGSFAAGGLAGMCAAAATYPLDLARGVLGGQGKGSIWQVLVDAFRRGGMKALYRGATPTLLGAIPFDGIRFGVVGVLRRYPHEPESRGRAVGRSAVYGGCGGLVAGVATFPNDTIRRCLQQPQAEYRGYVDCALSLVRADGVPRLYRGLAPSLLRAAPSAAIQFAAFDFFSGVVLGRA
jgi:hypothetical protein